MKVGDMVCVADFHDLCLRQSCRLCRNVGVIEFVQLMDGQMDRPTESDVFLSHRSLCLGQDDTQGPE